MLCMIELQYTREHRDEALRYFWEHGATHYEGKVTVHGAWVATEDLVAYALVDAVDPDELAFAGGLEAHEAGGDLDRVQDDVRIVTPRELREQPVVGRRTTFDRPELAARHLAGAPVADQRGHGG